MTPAAYSISASSKLVQRFVEQLSKLWQTRRGLTLFTGLMALASAFFAVGIIADSRMVTGVPVWLKPTKFAISIAIYTLTLAWLLNLVTTDKVWKRRLVIIASNTILWMLIVEIAVITLQAARGTTSHFNFSTALNGTLFTIMAIAINILWIANFVIAGILLFERFASPVIAWSVRLGMTISIIGMGLGFLMTSPTAQQRANWAVGEEISIVGAHTVGTPDGGEGLPFFNWSTEGGDLRIGHFIGMHALQILPLLGWFLDGRQRRSQPSRPKANRNARRQHQHPSVQKTSVQKTSAKGAVALIFIAASYYLAITLLVTWQALRAQSIIAPDALTINVFAALSATALVASYIASRLPQRTSGQLLGEHA
ncbi:MAG: hypothetical protein AAF708_22820 [Deinococcota bacterium]